MRILWMLRYYNISLYGIRLEYLKIYVLYITILYDDLIAFELYSDSLPMRCKANLFTI